MISYIFQSDLKAIILLHLPKQERGLIKISVNILSLEKTDKQDKNKK